jgi:hypothetical protein
MSRLRDMQTTEPKSFIEVLENEIRADLRKEIEAELAARYGSAPFTTPLTAQESVERAPSAAVHAAGRLETWLASHVGPITFKTGRSYAPTSAKSRPSPAASATPSKNASQNSVSTIVSTSAPVFTATTSAQLFAIEILNSQSPLALAVTFTEDQLRIVWRKAALKTHPDRFASADEITQLRMTVIFRELADAYETLQTLIESTRSEAA